MVKVMIVDDSAVARSTLREVFAGSEDIQVIGSAPDPLIAFPIMYEGWPDVIVSDIEMPRMDGIRFIRRIMTERPTPVIALTSTNDLGVHVATEAIKEGVFSLFPKPPVDVSNFIRGHVDKLVSMVRAAHAAQAKNLFSREAFKLPAKSLIGGERAMGTQEKVVAIGISNGGIQALQYLLSSLPEDSNGIVIAHHLPSEFMRKLSHQLNKASRLQVKIAEDGDVVEPGQVFLAPGGKQCCVNMVDGRYQIALLEARSKNDYCPSIDMLFNSLAQNAGKNAIGILMTGFGADGAVGLKALADSGAETIAQDEASSVVFGMPREAIKLGAAKHVVSLYDLPEHIYQYCH
ncbi:Chemotaxis response regulator protein-glutamate methylesterase [Thalassocella blandensis]|nr:Chemotaxis response regulator protein-glutamate methylesterase [Thalassocella blandensis]